MLHPADDPSSPSRRSLVLGSLAALSLQGCRSAPQEPVTRSDPRNSASSSVPLDLEAFVAECVTAAGATDPQQAVREVLARAVSDPAAMLAAAGPPERAGITTLHRSTKLTVFSAVWTPQMTLMPHDHRMWALIGIYTGREDNILWRRSERGVTAFGAEALFEGDVGVLPTDVIHSVTNPLERFTGGIHVYGGDFFAEPRSEWDPRTLEEHPFDPDHVQQAFDEADERWRESQGVS
jgi:predicted metal-dependent enzyme (double-stranded beta helix superfamily)